MVKEKLIIAGKSIPLLNGINTVLTYSITDIQRPDKRKAAFSKTINLPSSKVLDDVFNFVFEINIDGTFNANLKTDASYFIDDVRVFNGYIQLKEIIKIDEDVSYSVVLMGELANIFVDFGELYIDDNDMNWSDFNHSLNVTNVSDSWATQYYLNGVLTPYADGSGYVYPMINYGWDFDLPYWYTEYMYPASFVKEYIDRIFSSVGYSYTSTFFDSAYFKKLIIPFSGKEFSKSDLAVADMVSDYSNPFFATSGTASNSVLGVYDVLEFQTLTQDNLTQYNTTTGEFTPDVNNGGTYIVGVDLWYTITFNSGAPNVADMISTFQLDLIIKKNGSQIDQFKAYVRKDGTIAVGSYTTASAPTYPDPEYMNAIVDLSALPDSQYSRNFAQPNRQVLPVQTTVYVGDIITVELKGAYVPDTGETLNFRDTVTSTKYTGTATINLLSQSVIQHEPDVATFQVNDVIDFQSAIPKKIKKRDFFKSIVEMFNLYVSQDLNNPKNLIIETREDFYNTIVEDWSDKLAINKDIKIEPLAKSSKTKYTYSYKSDKDYYNKLYTETWGLTYGHREINLVNDFYKGEYNQSVIFSPTPSVGTTVHNRIIPSIMDVDKNLQPVRVNANIRMLIYGGLKTSNQTWHFRDVIGGTTVTLGNLTTYPYCGHFNDPYNPTEDINFGLPREIYYDNTFGTITVTNNNLYNKYHKKELEEQTDKDSKLLTAWFLLKPIDILNLDFRSQYYFDGAYFRLQEVKYKPNSYDLSECKFLKLKTKEQFTPLTLNTSASFQTKLAGENVPTPFTKQMTNGNVLSTRSANVKGSNNYIAKSSTNVDIVGNGNQIYSDSSNIFILGDGNIIQSGITNVTLLNTNNVKVDISNVIYANGVKI